MWLCSNYVTQHRTFAFTQLLLEFFIYPKLHTVPLCVFYVPSFSVFFGYKIPSHLHTCAQVWPGGVGSHTVLTLGLPSANIS